MTLLDIVEIIFIVLVFGVSIVGFVKAIKN